MKHRHHGGHELLRRQEEAAACRLNRTDAIQLEESVALGRTAIIGRAAFSRRPRRVRASALQVRELVNVEGRLRSKFRSGHTTQAKIAQDAPRSCGKVVALR